MRIDAEGIHYRELNEQIHAALSEGVKEFTLDNVRGQRYIGAGLNGGARVVINGVPGNDLGAFMNGAEIIVRGNGQDGVGNTMNSGKIVIRGDAGDVLGHSMRGGKIFVSGSAGYRAGIHMKEYRDHLPLLVIGGRAKDYVGEYMAGGVLVVLGMGSAESSPVGEYVGTGMHGGVIYVRGKVEEYQLGREVGLERVSDDVWSTVRSVLAEYGGDFELPLLEFQPGDFVKLIPKSSRPYGKLYAY